MGLFSRTRIYVDSLSLKLVEDTPNYIRQSILTSIKTGRSIPEDIQINMANSLGAKLNHFYKYGRDKYYYGLPTGTLHGESASLGTVQGVIEREIGSPVFLNYCLYNNAMPYCFVEKYLLETRGFDFETGIISKPPPEWKDVKALIYLDWETLEFIPTTDGAKTATKVKAEYWYKAPGTERIFRTTEDIAIGFSVQTDADYYHVQYQKQQDSQVITEDSYPIITESGSMVIGEQPAPEPDTNLYWWFYQTGSNKYPELEVPEKPDSPYMPVVPLRYAKKDLTLPEYRDTEAFKTSKRLLKKLRIDIDDLASGINGSKDKDKPDNNLKDIEHVYMMCGISTQTKSQAARQYMFAYWLDMFNISLVSIANYLAWQALPKKQRDRRPPPINAITIQEKGIAYDVQLGFLYILQEQRIGQLEDVDKDKKTFKLKVGQVKISNEIKPKSRPEKSRYGYETSVYILEKQLVAADTKAGIEGIYQRIEVHGIHHINFVNGRAVSTTLKDAVDYNNDPKNDTKQRDGMLIPLSTRILQDIKLVDRTEIMYEAMRIMFQAQVKKKVKWYQTGFFKFFTIVVSIAITIASFGTMSGSIAWAAGLVGSSSAIVGAIVLGGIVLAATFGTVLALDLLGIDTGWVLAIISAVAFLIPGGFMNPALIGAIQSGIQLGTDFAIDAELSDIQREYDELRREQEEWQQELEEYNKDSSTNILIDPMIHSRSYTMIDLNETPEQYYNNRIHSGNAGPTMFKYIENFVPLQLDMEHYEPMPTVNI